MTLLALACALLPTGAARLQQAPIPPIVFVQRQIPDQGTLYWAPPRDLPGVGTRSRFRVAAPGKLMRLDPGAAPVALVDGSQPTAASLDLIDVSAPSVSWDGQTIVFAGLPAGNYSPEPANNPGAWRLYTIRRDGTGLTQVTFSDQSLDLSQFGPAAAPLLEPYDDTDPAFLPDGRIVFTSTRWPGFSHYGKHFPAGIRASNLHVVEPDGSGLHRITTGHHGADRPLVDPVTGRVVFFRWWFNFRTATQRMSTIPDPKGGYLMKLGLTISRKFEVGGPQFISDNSWHAAVIDPDGTHLAKWTGFLRDRAITHAYGGAFTPTGDLIANFFPMFNMTEASGFGGLRRYARGPGTYAPIAGITEHGGVPAHPTALYLYKGEHFAEPDVLPDGRILASRAPDYFQDYGIYVMDPDGSNRQLVFDAPGTTEIRARALIARPLPPVIPDQVTQVPSLLPPLEGGLLHDGTFVFDALNVYANAPVDVDIVSAPAVGSAAQIRFFLDMQRVAPGSLPNLDWPILLAELPVEPDGSVRNPRLPANLPLFEQLRDPLGLVPFTNGPFPVGAAHVTGLNFGRPGTVVSCVGCHAGHTLMAVPANPAEARWTNLAPGASVRVSSTRDAQHDGRLIDRRAAKGEIFEAWTSAPGQQNGQWVELAFVVPITVRAVRLYDPRKGEAAGSTLHVGESTVRLFSDPAGLFEVASAHSGPLALAGTDVPFPDVRARLVRIELDSVTGTFYGSLAAGLAEVEVLARAEAGP